MEAVYVSSRNKSDRSFGLLENCEHCFCVTCIMRWRDNGDGDMETRRKCPLCRAEFGLVTPSRYWIECAEEKALFIEKFKRIEQSKPCPTVRERGVCPLGEQCFHIHAVSDAASQKSFPEAERDLLLTLMNALGNRLHTELMNSLPQTYRSSVATAHRNHNVAGKDTGFTKVRFNIKSPQGHKTFVFEVPSTVNIKSAVMGMILDYLVSGTNTNAPFNYMY